MNDISQKPKKNCDQQTRKNRDLQTHKNRDLHTRASTFEMRASGKPSAIEDSGDHIIITCTISKKDLTAVVSDVTPPTTLPAAPSSILSSSFGELKRIEWRDSK